ncbi:MAG TPA: hypothetical protein VLX91_03915 [Candidatus Acidoferrales bacterium]|nr:hypothetical protein [Candidatus Acidoferrales bacterium]
MRKKLFFMIVSTCLLLVSAPSRVPAQVTQFSLSEVVDSSSLIVIGRVDSEYQLSGYRIDSTSKPGYYGILTDLDGSIIRISVQQVLKGDSGGSDLSIFLKTDEAAPKEGPGVSFTKQKTYLLFLNLRAIDSTIAVKYSLSREDYYFPYLSGYGVVLLEGKNGLNELETTENYLLSLPTVPPKDTPLSFLLDSLADKTQEAYSNRWIGNQDFVGELERKLDNAKKHLVKGDSIACCLSLQNYQREVDTIYEKTLRKEIGGKNDESRFISPEGWKLLHYYAQYVIDRLPCQKK